MPTPYENRQTQPHQCLDNLGHTTRRGFKDEYYLLGLLLGSSKRSRVIANYQLKPARHNEHHKPIPQRDGYRTTEKKKPHHIKWNTLLSVLPVHANNFAISACPFELLDEDHTLILEFLQQIVHLDATCMYM